MELPDALTRRGNLNVTGPLVYDIRSPRVRENRNAERKSVLVSKQRLKTRHSR